MNLTCLAAAVAIAAGVGISGLTSGVAPATAAPFGSAPELPDLSTGFGWRGGIPAAKCWAYGRVGPGSPLGGGGVPGYLPQCKASAPPPR